MVRYSCLAAVLLLAPIPGSSQTETQIIKPAPSAGFLKRLTIESFGYPSSPVLAGYEFSPTNTSAFYNLHQLNCPLCIIGPPVTRTRAVLPPFGATASYNLWNDRFILFASFGGIDGVPTANTPRLNQMLMRATSFNDDWFATSDIGARVSIDPEKNVSLSITHSYVNDFGPGKARWSNTVGGIDISSGLFQEIAHGIRKAGKHSTPSDQDQ
ncbi:MAG TPA: hypothetical protein VH601_04640 [Bryobacteraceae bacterium]